ncbi:hypothetical protein CEUSTIGMA_g7607.t1 [Chlamydomonas eustigma]|uniref:Uncharacterized protein n=1 Tax=Chlamydomonas eustigma TaxID=1157962 RepID=A0A250XBA1_9CHLO|nr:hypothetical protein CEUSTIGMA_g7607.t1 [Chlamydomonas eustigma]|eukprot:GAX80169.1 hypothetical protein CEUSTIGMA_g7607.t1 [Chlamydomonas eustigma]
MAACWSLLKTHAHTHPTRASNVKLSSGAINNLKFCLLGFESYNGVRKMWKSPRIDITIYTDAAAKTLKNLGGWAGWTGTLMAPSILLKTFVLNILVESIQLRRS